MPEGNRVDVVGVVGDHGLEVPNVAERLAASLGSLAEAAQIAVAVSMTPGVYINVGCVLRRYIRYVRF